jgi:alkanesulfonate monooxygenase SsuD/methylene tetrahydromethanopterin reductase-like flavin-dependent oxidoreductase (luciferase family)
MDIAFITPVTAQSGDLRELARTVESLGYDSLWIPEHPVIPLGPKTRYPFQGELPEHYGRWVDPFVALTVAAMVTSKIKLATGICLLPEREVLITAKAIASLDLFSGGRVILGVGAGWLREETEAMGANFGQRWKHTREFVEAMKLVWTTDDPSYDGEIIKFCKNPGRRSSWGRMETGPSHASRAAMMVGCRLLRISASSKAPSPPCASRRRIAGAIPPRSTFRRWSIRSASAAPN